MDVRDFGLHLCDKPEARGGQQQQKQQQKQHQQQKTRPA